jgi:hypothetical protein
MTRERASDTVAALARFEKRLEIPIVPGEMPGWLQLACESSRDVGDALRRQVAGRHQEMLTEINPGAYDCGHQNEAAFSGPRVCFCAIVA